MTTTHNQDGPAVIEAEHYRTTRAALAADPIIIGMYETLPVPLRMALATDTVPTADQWPLTQIALRTYNERGGTIATHIGGPREALAIIAKNRGGR